MRYHAAVFIVCTDLLICSNLILPYIIPTKHYQEYFLIAAGLPENCEIIIPAFWQHRLQS